MTEESLRRGPVALDAGRNSIRLIPPLVVSGEQIDEGIEILEDAVKAAEKRVGS